MVSAQGSDFTPYDFSFTYHLTDIYKPVSSLTYSKNSLIDVISKEPQFSKFSYLIKLGGLAAFLDSYTLSYTLFVPIDSSFQFSDEVLVNMDKYTARETVLYHILPMKLPLSVLKSSKEMYLNTKINQSISAKILCQNWGIYPTLNNTSQVISTSENGYKAPNNGIIHPIDKLLVPPIFKTSFQDYVACGAAPLQPPNLKS